jgi:adenylosuccinate lyase
MTSSDVLDTCFNIQLTRAADILISDMEALLAALKRRAYEHKDTLRIGRSHGIHAEPTTMGLTFARFYAEMQRNLRRLRTAREEIATGAISGAVPSDPAGPPRRILCRPWCRGQQHRECRHRDPPYATHRSA